MKEQILSGIHRVTKRDDKAFATTIQMHNANVQDALTQLRALVLDTARATPGVGRIEEALRWGQHSFLTPETGSGSTIRIGGVRHDPEMVAMYFHCQSGLIPAFKELYGGKLTYDGKRALLFQTGKRIPAKILAHCIALALTHHLRKKVVDKTRVLNDPPHHYRHRSRAG